MIKFSLILITMTLSFTIFLGKTLDWEAERVIEQLYARDQHGIINGLAGFHDDTKNPGAIIFVHGFLDSPEIFKDYFNHSELRQHYDILVPRLRFHARDLQSARHFNNKVIEKSLLKDIQFISKQHQYTTIVAQSYAGALTLNLLNQEKLPPNAKVILLAPALFIKENNLWGNFKLYGYGLWRNYCNYPQLGYQFPGYGSGDASARTYFAKAMNLRYLVIPALKQLFQFDRQNRTLLSSTKHAFSIIIAKDDNRVDYEKIKYACQQNPACQLYSYPSGRHLLQQSQFKDDLLTQIQELSGTMQKNLAI